MTTQSENPTQSSGDSIQDRIEAYLSPEEPKPAAEAAPQAAEAAPTETPEVEPSSDEGDHESEPQLSLTDLAKYLGVNETALDVDEAGALNLKTKVDGEEGKAKLSDLITSYQLRAHLDKETRAVAEQRKAIEAQSAWHEQQIAARARQVEDLTNAAQMELNREFQNVDWQTLRVTDPAEYAASLQDYQARQAHINNIANQANQHRQQFAAKQQQGHAAFLQEQAQALPTLIPEWSDPVVADKERAEIRDFALNLGIAKADVDSISHAAHVAVLRKAMLYDRMQTSKTAMEKKVVSAPRLVKPGQTAPRNSNETSVRSLKASVQKSGGKMGIEEYLIATGKV